jgi:TRAP-type uncharacterized transport system fused permease subunit
MLWVGTTWQKLIQTLVTSCTGMTVIGASMVGFMLAPMSWLERGMFLIGGMAMVHPGTTTDLAGFGVIGVALFIQWRKKKAGVVSTATTADA